MTISDGGPALLVVDVQQAFDGPGWGRRNNPAAEANIARLLVGWRTRGDLVLHVRHLSTEPGQRFSPDGPGFAVKAEAAEQPGEAVLTKTVNSAFIGTDLQARLDRLGVRSLVVVGLTTDHCVSTTVRMAGNYGYDAVIVSDATATFERTGPDGRHWSAAQMHDTALASLHDEFATVLTTDEVLRRAPGLGRAAAAPTDAH